MLKGSENRDKMIRDPLLISTSSNKFNCYLYPFRKTESPKEVSGMVDPNVEGVNPLPSECSSDSEGVIRHIIGQPDSLDSDHLLVSPNEESLEHSIATARSGLSALGQLFETYRDYLLTIAKSELSSDLVAKLAPSDVVQETFAQAARDFPRFQGETNAELKAWLKQILHHNLLDLIKRYKGTAMRNISQEFSIESHISNIPHPQSSPSSIMMGAEAMSQFQVELNNLPSEHRRIIELRSIEGRSFNEIGQELGKSADAIRKIWARAVDTLSERLTPKDDSSR